MPPEYDWWYFCENTSKHGPITQDGPRCLFRNVYLDRGCMPPCPVCKTRRGVTSYSPVMRWRYVRP